MVKLDTVKFYQVQLRNGTGRTRSSTVAGRLSPRPRRCTLIGDMQVILRLKDPRNYAPITSIMLPIASTLIAAIRVFDCRGSPGGRVVAHHPTEDTRACPDAEAHLMCDGMASLDVRHTFGSDDLHQLLTAT
jgi:hypothetical protein